MAPKKTEAQEKPKKIDGFKNFLRHAFPDKKLSENFAQYLFRQMYVPDSNGRPSITTSILMFVMILIGVVAATEITVALSRVTVTAPDGTVTTSLKGVGAEFMYLLIALSVVVTKFNNDRATRIAKEGVDQRGDAGTAGAEGIIDKAVEMVSKIKGGGR